MALERPHSLPCQHEGGTGEYHPLTLAELRELLTIASTTRDIYEANDIHCRLTQAVRGITCPHPIEGEVAERISAVGSLYVETIKSDPASLPGLVGEFYKLLEPEG